MSVEHIFLKLKLKGDQIVVGESMTKGFYGWIEVLSFKWGAEVVAPTKMLGSEINEFKSKQFELTKYFDKASHLIHKSAYLKAETDGSANNVVSAEVVVCSPVIPGSDEAPSRIMSILFKDGRIDKVDLASSENARSIKVEETLKMNFRQVKYSFFKRSESGGSRTTAQDFEWKSKLQTLDNEES